MRPEFFLRSRSPDETRDIAEIVAPFLGPGDVIALSGDLGAGKTCFVQGAARGLGVKERVTSPSFVLMRTYHGSLPVLHLDVYRLNSLHELEDIGFEELLDPGHVMFIEWGDAITPLLPEEHLEVVIKVASDDERTITLLPFGSNWMRRVAAIAERMGEWEKSV
ncbi:MAG: tRNA (adenosine(37)-N6)-threonylcarbamoyltransferase complex ATPase subunit type 1 TsaE [Actinomycetota bacterium]|nr:tRNA (adenosine(37)-N6)-threonylcarbamoyltransferase complex ATPase subunit type 1 TsaE [Actinomycetota bacterium]